MTKIKNINFLIVLVVGFSLILGSVLRLYNINYENLWFDEIVTFWITDPFIEINENYKRNNAGGASPFLFSFLLTLIHEIFGYKTYVARYFSAAFGILSIISLGYLSNLLKKNNAYILVVFLISLNVFLIKYSQEARVFSFLFFLCTLSIIFLIKSFQSYEIRKKLFLNSFLYILFQTLAFLTHPFALIIFFTVIAYYFFYYLNYKKNLIFLNYIILTVLIIVGIYLPIYIENITIAIGWIEQPKLKFYTNFYFSSFFGSRIMGLIHLLILSVFILIFRDRIFKHVNFITFFIILIFLSYFIPLLYGWIYKPIIHSRYIIFVLIPIIITMSYFVFEIQNKYIKQFMIYFLVFMTLGNQLTETNFQQFFKERTKYKPDYLSPLNIINKSSYKNYFINHNFHSHKNNWSKIFENYFESISKEKNLNVNLLELSELKENKFKNIWIICPKDLMGKKCEKIQTNRSFKFKIIENIEFNKVNLKLISFN
tara:strand:- start:718 stop:2169 length:1452 start_codon:yes stop_codon:yes gene_type:complete